MWYIFAVFLFHLSVIASGNLNYCSSKMCGHTDAHTFCQYSNAPGRQCKGNIDVTLSDEEKIRILIRLNQRRAAAASGRLKRFPPASNMMKLMWVDELAREAQLWANQCEPPRTPETNDVCRDLYSVSVGQCVASVIGEAPGLRIESLVDLWYMQSMFYKGNITQYTPPGNNQFNYYGDFAQLLFARSFMVGCGRSKFMAVTSGRLRSVERLVCNFAPRGPIPGHPMWMEGIPGSLCPPRSVPDLFISALCTFKNELDEFNDQDHILSLEEHILLDTIFALERNDSLKYNDSIDEIYLTKIAIATMKNIVPIKDINGLIQKRDIFNVDLDNSMKKNLLTYDVNSNDIHNLQPKSMSKAKKALMKIPKSDINKLRQKIKLIGRPKSYNMEELNEDNNVDINTASPDTTTNLERHREFYDDYDVFENTEKTTDESEATSVSVAMSVATNEYTNKSISPFVTNTTVPSTTDTSSTTIQTITTEEPSSQVTTELMPIYTVNNVVINENNATISINDSDALLDEYLSDPENVKKLQEEIAKLEKQAAAVAEATSRLPSTIDLSQNERSDKVRRALKETFGDERNALEGQIQNLEENENLKNAMVAQPINPLVNGNRSFEQPAVMNMVMKYMPMLKDYKNTASTSNTVSHTNLQMFFVIAAYHFVRLLFITDTDNLAFVSIV